MRKLLLILLVLSSFVASSQKIQKDNTYGREFNRFMVDTLFGLPKDTFTVPSQYQDIPWWASKQGSLYRWDTASYTWRIYGLPSQACPANGVLNGSASVTWQGTGYNFSVAPGLYMIDCNNYTSDSGTVTLSTSDPDFDRFDVIYLATDGAFHVLEGTPSASAAIPQVQGDEIALTAILVPAGSTAFEPDEQIIYDENTESVVTNTGTTTNGNNLTNVFTGTKSLNVTNINNGDLIYFTKISASTWDITGVDILSLHVKLKAVMPQLANLRVALYNGITTPVSAEIAIPLDRNNITTYQAISIPLSAFGNITTNQFTQVRLRYTSNNANNYTGYYLDYLSFVDNLPTLPPTGAQVNLTLHPNGPALVINPSEQIQNGGTWNILGGGNSSQYITGALTLNTFPTLVDSIGALDGRSKNDNGGTIDLTTGTFHQQLASDLYPGLLSSALYTKINRNDSITNLGTGDTLLVYVSDTLLGIKSLVAGSNITLTPSATGITIASTGGGTTETASGGLSKVVNDIRLGGSALLANTSLSTSAFSLTIPSSNANRSLLGSNSSSGNGVEGTSTSGNGVYGSGGAYGVAGYSAAGAGVQAYSDSGLPLEVTRNTSTTNAVVRTSYFLAQSTGTAANGFGGSIDLRTSSSGGADQISNQLISKWTNATTATRTSQFDITGVNSAATETFANFQTGGVVRVNNLADTLATKAYARSVGGGSGSGTVNTGAANTLAYYSGAGTTVDDLTAITASRALVSDANGLPVAATTTATEIGYVNGVTSGIQSQIDAKADFAGSKRIFWIAPNTTSSLLSIGVQGATASGTITTPTPGNTNRLTATRRTSLSTGAAAPAVARISNSALEVWRGDAAGLGGFTIVYTFGLNTTVTGNRVFVGLIDNTTFATNVDPTTSTATARIGMALNAATGNWQFCTNTSGAAPSVTDLGSNFPVNTTDLLQLKLYAAPNGSSITYTVTNLSTGNVSGPTAVSSNLPSASSFLANWAWICNNATASAAILDVAKIYVESNY